MYLTCTFKKGPPSVEYIRKEWEKLKRKLRTVFRKAGKEFRYVSIIENETGGGRPHGHIIIPQLDGLTMAQVRKMWGLGFVKAAEYGGAASDARNLAAYFTKSKTAHYNSGIQNSKNLIQNEPKETLVKRSETFYGKIRPPKGYIPIEVDGWTASGFTEEGYPYIRTVFELYEPPPPRKRRRDVLPKEEQTYAGRGKEKNQRGRYEKPIPGGA